MRYICNHKGRLYSNLLIRNPLPLLCLLPFHLMIFCVCQMHSDNLQRLGGRACCFQSKVDIRWHKYICFSEYFVNTGVCLWSGLWSWLSWRVLVEKLVSFLLPLSAMDFSLHDCWTSVRNSLSKKIFFLFDSEGLTPKSDIYRWCLRQLEKKKSAGKYHCSCTENMWHHIICCLACYL